MYSISAYNVSTEEKLLRPSTSVSVDRWWELTSVPSLGMHRISLVCLKVGLSHLCNWGPIKDNHHQHVPLLQFCRLSDNCILKNDFNLSCRPIFHVHTWLYENKPCKQRCIIIESNYLPPLHPFTVANFCLFKLCAVLLAPSHCVLWPRTCRRCIRKYRDLIHLSVWSCTTDRQ
jgi:hypothetical protein